MGASFGLFRQDQLTALGLSELVLEASVHALEMALGTALRSYYRLLRKPCLGNWANPTHKSVIGNRS
jgi:hypothetical protein